MLYKRSKIAIRVQQIIIAENAARGDHRIDGLANGDTRPAQHSKVSCRLNRDIPPCQIHNGEGCQKSAHLLEFPLLGEPLQHFGQNQVADGQGFGPEELVKLFGLRCDCSVKIVDPYAGIDQNHLSVLIALRSPCQCNLPRNFRISACLEIRNKVCKPNSTASRLVFKPVARNVSSINLSSITMFVLTMCILPKFHTHPQPPAK